MNKSNIKDAVIAVTYRCNSRCIMCNIWQKNDFADFPAEDLLLLPPSLKDINITGGEPFLRSDLVDLIINIRKACPKSKIIISSNGFATEQIVAQVKKILPLMPELGIAFSIDGLAEKHDRIRGVPGGFSRVMETIRQLQLLGMKNIKISYTMGDYNFEELSKVYDLSKKLKTEFTMAVVHSSENYFGKENNIDNKELLARELDWLIKQELSGFDPKRWARAFFTQGLKQLLQDGTRILPDYSGKQNIFIDPAGDIYPSDISSEKIGELKNISLISTGPDSGKANWMMCTARPAIKKHFLKVGFWILKKKFFHL